VIISLIVAMDEKRGIGKNNQLPWSLSDDLKRFKALTMGHHIIMGRKTYESIARLLPGRTMVIVTRNPEYDVAGALVANSLPMALEIAEKSNESEVFIVGGAEIFTEALPLAERIYLTLVHSNVDADVFFPEFDHDDWIEDETSFMDANDKNEYPMSFVDLVKDRNTS
jgi:dihydrofolate reductase